MARRHRSKTRIPALLNAACAAQSIVRVVRSFGGNSDVTALVLAVSERWVVLAPLSDAMTLDGYNVVRRSTVMCVQPDPSEGFVRRALDLNGGLRSTAPVQEL